MSWRPSFSVIMVGRRRRWRRCSWRSRPPWRPGTPSTNPAALAEQRATWHAQAAETLGGPDAVQAMISRRPHPGPTTSPIVDAEWVAATADEGAGGGGGTPFDLAELACPRRSATPRPGRRDRHRQGRSAGGAARRRGAANPIGVADSHRRRHQRAGGVAAGRRFAVSTRLPDPSCSPPPGSWPPSSDSSRPRAAPTAASWTPARSSWRCWRSAANGNALDAGQAALVRAMCTSGARLQLAIAPAGAGKTTAMRTLARAWTRQRRPGGRAGPVRRRGCAAPRRHRRTSRNAGQAHLVHPPRLTCPTGRTASAGPRW